MNTKEAKYWDEGIDLVSGCTPVSEGCDHCWHRAGLTRWGQDPDKIILHPERLQRLEKGKPKIISIWSDLFHPDVPDDFIGQALDAAARGPHQVLILTKRVERMAWFFTHCPISDNVWPGVTVESQDQIGRLWWLKHVDCPRRWVSVEPILSNVDINPSGMSAMSWGIVGCETGPEARLTPHTNDHIASVVRHCQAAEVPAWVKATVGTDGRPTTKEDRDRIVRQRPEALYEIRNPKSAIRNSL